MTDAMKEVEAAIVEAIGCEGITAEQRLKEDIGLDSLSLVSVIVGLEERLGILFDDADLDPGKIVLVKDVADLVEKYA